jgi:hypothetical protein
VARYILIGWFGGFGELDPSIYRLDRIAGAHPIMIVIPATKKYESKLFFEVKNYFFLNNVPMVEIRRNAFPLFRDRVRPPCPE